MPKLNYFVMYLGLALQLVI